MIRVKIVGDDDLADLVREYLERGGIDPDHPMPRYTVTIAKRKPGTGIVFDSAAGELEAAVFKFVRELTPSVRILTNIGAVSDPEALTIYAEPKYAEAIASGVLRAFQALDAGRKGSWLRRLFS